MLLPSMRGRRISLPVGLPVGGTISTEKTIAAGALMNDAARMWPSASGTRGPTIPA